MRTALVALAIVCVPIQAWALTQPDGTPIPAPPGCASGNPSGLDAVFACACTQPGVCNIGSPCASQSSCDNGVHGTCESTMWHSFNDNTCIPSNHGGLDPYAEAATTPETFHPTCALTFTLVTRATAQFKNLFGWYNATGHAPPTADLHLMFGCADGAGKAVTLDLSKEPGYAGGDVGFFLLTPESHTGSQQCASGDCCPSIARLNAGEGYVYYSQKAYNPDQHGPNPFIHLLTYTSHITPAKFYFAWKDEVNGGDNNFTNLVASVEGVECSGAGAACDTGKKGICALGATHCASGALTCQEIFPPGAEKCDGLDNDCDGVVDNGATCPSAGDLCQNGKCVHHCGSAEFKCAASTRCDEKTGFCVEAACVGVSCSADKICKGGQCVAPCEGVTCPHGQACVGNACVDLCSRVSCAPGQVCSEGICVGGCNQCGGLQCAAPLACGANGACVDPSCASTCPLGTYCKAGQCVDACDGAKCPDGEICSGGQCGGVGLQTGGDGGLTPVGADGGVGEGGNPDSSWGQLRTGCACDLRGASPGHAAAPLALLAGIAVLARRRRR